MVPLFVDFVDEKAHRDPKDGSWFIQDMSKFVRIQAANTHLEKTFKKVDGLIPFMATLRNNDNHSGK